ncbi:MAG: phosphoglycerate kinase [Acidobacteriota bacterium]|nr:phosphoglycerate kinase [Acidobacteriota bacterium]
MNKLSIRDLDLGGRRLFIRADFNVPLDEAGRVADAARIQASLPTIRFALSRGAKVLLASHLGRPRGRADPGLTLKPVAAALEAAIGRPVKMAGDCVGEAVERQSAELGPGQVLLLENLRFHPEEEANRESFCRGLARLCDCYVNDAFGAAHRAHASTAGMVRFVGGGAAGLLMERELSYLGKALERPDRPFVAVLGGAKVSDKIEVIENLMQRVDGMLVGGGMAYTFLRARGVEVGRSLVEEDKISLARGLLRKAEQAGIPLVLPVDHVVTGELEPDAPSRVIPVGETGLEWMGVDIGPQTRSHFQKVLSTAGTVLWNGPVGVFEIDRFAGGTLSLAQAAAASPATTIVGGGDSIAAVRRAGVADRITHISTGGGASLEFLSGRKLPGVESLSDRP